MTEVESGDSNPGVEGVYNLAINNTTYDTVWDPSRKYSKQKRKQLINQEASPMYTTQSYRRWMCEGEIKKWSSGRIIFIIYLGWETPLIVNISP